MTPIETIPQEATDLTIHVALCAQRHREMMQRLDAAREDLSRLREDLRRLGILVVIASGSVSTVPYIAQAWPAIARVIGL